MLAALYGRDYPMDMRSRARDWLRQTEEEPLWAGGFARDKTLGGSMLPGAASRRKES